MLLDDGDEYLEEFGWAEIHFPPTLAVEQHLAVIESAHPSLWEEHLTEILEEEEVWFLETGWPHNVYFALLKTGLVWPVFIETSEDEAFYVYRFWNPLMMQHQSIEEFDRTELKALIEAISYVRRLN